MVENTRSGKKISKKVRRKRKIIIFAVEILVLLVLLAGLYIGLKLVRMDTGNKVDETKRETNELTVKTQETLKGYTTIALFGLDNRSSGSFKRGNSDVIMIASIDNQTKEVKLVSVYRDTYLNLTDNRGFNKANAAYSSGGPEQAISMLNVNLDLDITDYVTVDFNSVVTAVDLLGGVEVEITGTEAELMRGYMDEITEITGTQSDYLWGEGTYNLDGVQATAYARIRFTAGDDYKRTERQRLIISKLVEKALSSDIATINNLANELFTEIQTSLSITDVLALAKDALSYSLGDNAGFPIEKTTKLMGGKAGDCVIPLDLASNVQLLHEFLYESQEYEVTEAVKNISDEIVTNTGLSASDAPQSTSEVQQSSEEVQQ